MDPALAPGATPTPGAAAGSIKAPVSGTVHQGIDEGLAVVKIYLSVAGQHLSSLRIHIGGHPVNGGGVSMTSSRVELGPSSDPNLYCGRVTSLAGTDIEARLSDSSWSAITLLTRLQLDPASGAATGTVTASP